MISNPNAQQHYRRTYSWLLSHCAVCGEARASVHAWSASQPELSTGNELNVNHANGNLKLINESMMLVSQALTAIYLPGLIGSARH